MVAEPNAFVTVASLSVPVGFGLKYSTEGLGVRAGLLELAVIARGWASLAEPVVIPDNVIVCSLAFSLMTKSFNGSSVGGLLTGLTVTRKERMTVLLMFP